MSTVLVVDDEPAIRRLITSALEAAGYRVLAAADGRHGIEVARAERPDVVLLDIALPAMSGLEVCRRLKADSATSQIRVIYLTGLAPEVGQRAASDTDAVGFVTKPFSPTSLVSQIAAALDPQHTIRTS